jgi:hypothetical protein
MGLLDEVRRHCAEVAGGARSVQIEVDRLGVVRPGEEVGFDRGDPTAGWEREAAAAYWLTLGSINFGSGWFPTIRKRAGLSGYHTIAAALAERFAQEGPWTAEELRRLDATAVAGVLGQDPGHELIELYARALRDLGTFLHERTALEVVEAAESSAGRVVEILAEGMPFFDDRGFYKRAQLLSSDLALAGVCDFSDLDRLTAFADNLVPHVLRVDGVLSYDEELAARIDANELVEAGSREELEIRACAVHACELIAAQLRVPPRVLDNWLWNRGQAPRYKVVPRHRTRTVYY